jgi:hypothetical protein
MKFDLPLQLSLAIPQYRNSTCALVTGDDAFADAVRAVLLTDAQARGAAVVLSQCPGYFTLGRPVTKTAQGAGIDGVPSIQNQRDEVKMYFTTDAQSAPGRLRACAQLGAVCFFVVRRRGIS